MNLTFLWNMQQLFLVNRWHWQFLMRVAIYGLSTITTEEFMGMKKIQNFQDNTLCSIFFSQSFKTLFVSKKNNEIFRFDLAKNSLASISETTLIVVEVIQPFKVSSKTNPKAYSWAPANLLMNQLIINKLMLIFSLYCWE